MRELFDMIWVETRKALRSRMPLWTGLGSLFLPIGMAFIIFVARNPQISQKLGLISAKANLLAYSNMDWPGYMGFFSLVIAAAGIALFVLIISWTFGREFADGTVKDMLAVPVQRGSILLAKYIVAALWSAGVSIEMLLFGLAMGALIRLPGASAGIIFNGVGLELAVAGLTIVVVLPFALIASAGRGYLLPIGLAFLIMIATNLVDLVGWGEYFPWAIPSLLAQAKTILPPASFWIVALTGLVGMLATYGWWKTADQNR